MSRKFNGEIAIADCIQRIFGNAVKAEQLRDPRAVDRKGGTGKRAGTQRQYVHALLALRKSRVIAHQHFKPGHHVMTKADWLGHLQMGIAWHQGIGLTLGKIKQSLEQTRQFGLNQVNLLAQV